MLREECGLRIAQAPRNRRQRAAKLRRPALSLYSSPGKITRAPSNMLGWMLYSGNSSFYRKNELGNGIGVRRLPNK